MNTSKASLFRRATSAFVLAAYLAAIPAYAGTPMICFPYEIGTAKSLPAGDDFKGTSATYDRASVVSDTLALLTPEMPVIVRMETMRRAAIYSTRNPDAAHKLSSDYSSEDRQAAFALLEKLRARAAAAPEKARAIALFDVGFFAETLRQINVDPALDGYEILVKARELRGPDATFEFALALASWRRTSETGAFAKSKTHGSHVALALAGSKKDPLLARNVSRLN